MTLAPFLEIKLNTGAHYFIQELFRLCEDLREGSPLQINQIWVRVSDLRLRTNLATNESVEPDIRELTGADLEAITQRSEATWTLIFNMLLEDGPWNAQFAFELRAIGGSHPLLVAFQVCSHDLYPFLTDVLERCGSLWDAQVIHHAPDNATLRAFFRAVDARPSPWLIALERRVYGSAFERFAPSSVRDQKDQADNPAALEVVSTEAAQTLAPERVDPAAPGEVVSTEAAQTLAPEQVDPAIPPEATPDVDAVPGEAVSTEAAQTLAPERVDPAITPEATLDVDAAPGEAVSTEAAQILAPERVDPAIPPEATLDVDAAPGEAVSTEAAQTPAPERVDPAIPPEATLDVDAAPGSERKQAPRMYGPTEEKVALVQQLLAEKRKGKHRSKPWLWACEQATLDLKTAQKHLAAERVAWNELNEQEQERARSRSKPKA